MLLCTLTPLENPGLPLPLPLAISAAFPPPPPLVADSPPGNSPAEPDSPAEDDEAATASPSQSILTAPPASKCADADVVSVPPPPPPSVCSPTVAIVPIVPISAAPDEDGIATLGVAADGVAAPAPAPAGLRADDKAVFDARDVLGAVDTEAAATVAAAVAAAICCIKLRLLLARLMPTDAAPRLTLTLTGAAAAVGFPRTDGTPTDPSGSPCA